MEEQKPCPGAAHKPLANYSAGREYWDVGIPLTSGAEGLWELGSRASACRQQAPASER